jgi:VanZ family protein
VTSKVQEQSAFWAIAPAIASMVVAFTLGSVPMHNPPGMDFVASDKVGHLIAFGLIQITHARAAIYLWPSLSWSGLIVRAMVSATLLGGLLELWQSLLPHRSADWADFAADGVGAVLFGLVYAAWGPRRV